jgi:hypothetical protein
MRDKLNEQWRKMVEMPVWNDDDKVISKYMGDKDIEKINDRYFQKANVIDGFNVQDLYAKVFQTKQSNGYNVHLFDGDGKEMCAFHWYKDGKKPWTTTSATVADKYQGKGIAFFVYTYMIDKYMHTLSSDDTLTGENGKGSFDLWVKLGKRYPYKYIYNNSSRRYKRVEGFTRDMMGYEGESFVVSQHQI